MLSYPPGLGLQTHCLVGLNAKERYSFSNGDTWEDGH